MNLFCMPPLGRNSDAQRSIFCREQYRETALNVVWLWQLETADQGYSFVTHRERALRVSGREQVVLLMYCSLLLFAGFLLAASTQA